MTLAPPLPAGLDLVGIDEPPPLAAGAEVAPGYVVVEHLRRGEDVDVYDVWSAARYCRCVVKVLRPDRGGDRNARRRLVAEGRLALSLTHPHLVRGYEMVTAPGGFPVLVLEAVTGATLSYLLAAVAPRLPVADLAHLGRHLCSATRYLHARGYLHVDIKPSNILSAGGTAKLIDLGLARRPGPCGAGVGTACYLSPEQARGGVLGPPTDVWGIGVVLHEAATGYAPFGDADASATGGAPEVCYPQLVRRAPRVRARRRLPVPAAAVLDACLDPDPAARPISRSVCCRASECTVANC